MTRTRPEEFVCDHDHTMVLDRMATLAAERGGWLNIRPMIDPDDEPPPPGLFAIFGGSIHKVPLATWMPGGGTGYRGRVAETVGLQHSAGPRVAAWLRQRDLALPDRTRVVQDHPRRGLVAEIDPAIPHETVLAWMFGACAVLCEVPTTGRWSVAVFRS